MPYSYGLLAIGVGACAVTVIRIPPEQAPALAFEISVDSAGHNRAADPVIGWQSVPRS